MALLYLREQIQNMPERDWKRTFITRKNSMAHVSRARKVQALNA
jgi:hypothetical protein